MDQTPLNPYHDFYDKLADDAAFFWVLRSAALKQPHFNQIDIVELEQRITARLDGLITSPEEAWTLCEAALEFDQEGEAFVAAVLAFYSLDNYKIQRAVEAGLASPQAFKGLTGALAWLPGSQCHSWIKKFLTSKDLNHKYLAITLCSLRREDPSDYLTAILQRADCIAYKPLYLRALRLIGELKRADLNPFLNIAQQSDDDDIIFWSHWSAVLLGDRAAANRLIPFIKSDDMYQQKAIDIVFRVLPIDDARRLIAQLAASPEQIRTVIKATAALGDPHAVSWLIAQMQTPENARLAGEAFTLITGIDIDDNQLALEAPPKQEGSNVEEDADDNMDMPEDEHLPYPDEHKVSALWATRQQQLVVGKRYFMGKLLEAEHLQNVFVTGKQRQRKMAALELALLLPQQFLLNSAAKGLTDE
ncbi:MAG: TIGR02270 family protein [Marinagarivorans sp.]|nr:TIGR02270 family protein [Marinagarivorans sp.]